MPSRRSQRISERDAAAAQAAQAAQAQNVPQQRQHIAPHQRSRYFDVLAFEPIYQSMTRAKAEGVATGMMNLVFNHYFPGVHGYDHRFEMKVVRGFADIDSQFWHRDSAPGARWQRRAFLITQCKRAERASQESAWEEGLRQLNRYMPTRKSRKGPMYGIVAIGRYVRFYSWSNRLNRAVNMFPNNSPLDLKVDVATVHRRMLHILNHHDRPQ